MANYTLKAESGQINFSPAGFIFSARDCLSCFESYNPVGFSLVKYFLACRTIELSLKALHLDSVGVAYVKKTFGHDLKLSYEGLKSVRPILSEQELELLSQASLLYDKSEKAFEYVKPDHAALAYSMFPDLEALYKLALRFVVYVECYQNANP
jgi:hypothetical protein